MAAEIILGEAYEIKELIILTGPRRRRPDADSGPDGRRAQEAGSSKQEGSRERQKHRPKTDQQESETGESKEGNLWQCQPYHTGAFGHLVFTACLWGH